MKACSSAGLANKMIFGTFNMFGEDLFKALDFGYKVGYRHIDTATRYKNENDVGTWIMKSGVERESLFLTTKVWPTDYRNVELSCDRSLDQLKTDYVDMFLLHWPVALKSTQFKSDFSHLDRIPLHQVWSQMESLKLKGKAKNIGVSNWNVSLLNDLLSYSSVPPALNQIEMHIYNQKTKLVSFCDSNNISVSAYRLVYRTPEQETSYKLQATGSENQLIRSLSLKYKATPYQIILKWALQRNCSVIVGAREPGYIQENWNSQYFSISEADMEAISQIPHGGIYTSSEKSVGIHIE